MRTTLGRILINNVFQSSLIKSSEGILNNSSLLTARENRYGSVLKEHIKS
jgi:hypothetical protein